MRDSRKQTNESILPSGSETCYCVFAPIPGCTTVTSRDGLRNSARCYTSKGQSLGIKLKELTRTAEAELHAPRMG